MPTRLAVQNGNWSNLATWNDSASLGFPTASDDVFANSFTVNVDTSFQVLTLRSTASPMAFPSIATPIMTSNTTPSGIASGYSVSVPTVLDAWRAFDLDFNTGVTLGTPPCGVVYQFPTGRIIKRYYFNALGGNSAPQSWTFQGSNDGSSWTTLDTVSTATAIFTSNILPNTGSFTYYRINVLPSGGSIPLFYELQMTEFSGSTLGNNTGGSFNFNSGSISGSVTSTTPLSAGATNLITVTAPSGTVGLTLGGDYTQIAGTGAAFSTFSHTGNCDFNLSGFNFFNTVGLTNTTIINKTSNGTLRLNCTLIRGGATNGCFSFASSAGNEVITGNVEGGLAAALNNFGIIKSGGPSLTVVGNVIGVGQAAINTTSTVFVTGNVTGSAAAGIVTTAPVIVTGNVVAQGAANAINAGSTATFINVSGSVISSATANAINATNASAVVNLAGNMVNTSGKTAIYCQNLFLSNTDTTTAQFVTIGSQDRTLYSADTFPNLPSASNVRFGTTYGPGSGNTGTLRMASPQDVRSGVLTDNTTGSAILSIESLSNEVQTSSDPFAQRLRNIATVDAVGYLLTAFKK